MRAKFLISQNIKTDIKSQKSVNNLSPVLGSATLIPDENKHFQTAKWSDKAHTQNEKWTLDAKLRLKEQLTQDKWGRDMKMVWRDRYSI